MAVGLTRLSRFIEEKRLAKPTAHEAKAIQQLRNAMRDLVPLDDSNLSVDAEAAWIRNRTLLRQCILKKDPRCFLHWGVIGQTMFVNQASYVNTELHYLEALRNWEKWARAIQETDIGRPNRFRAYIPSSGNSIHHAYSLALFEERARISLEHFDVIVEFGGGYGSMCRIIHKLGFKGDYFIFDFPELNALQEFYLDLNGISVDHLTSKKKQRTPDTQVCCVSDAAVLEDVLSHNKPGLFLSTWAISEAPMSIRKSLLPLVVASDAYLLAFQHQFREIDNLNFFDKWSSSLSHIRWKQFEIPHLPDNSYLFGVRKDEKTPPKAR